MMMIDGDREYDRAKEVKKFDDSKVGVKGLVDSGIASIPRFFVHPPETLSDLKAPTGTRSDPDLIPVVDLSGCRSAVIDQIRHASSEFGFFQIVNHGIPSDVLGRMIGATKAFHEQPTEIKGQVYRRGPGSGFSFFSNVDLFNSKAASWRDTIQIRLAPNPPEKNQIPLICREEVAEWDREVLRLGDVLMGLLSEGLGLDTERLKEMTLLEGRVMVGHYYPYCLQPDLTVGITSHTDPGVFTVLLQDQVGGLQVKYDGQWVDVKPVPGALVINVGDILQIISNDEFKSVEHRVLANPVHEPRVSIAVFFNPGARDDFYGPLPELVTPEKPALYQHFTLSDFMKRFFTKELDGKTLINFYKLRHKVLEP